MRVVFRALAPGPARVAIAAERVMDRDLREIASVMGPVVDVQVRDRREPREPREPEVPEIDP